MFTSKINVYPGTGIYAGCWVIRHDDGRVLWDAHTEQLAKAKCREIRKYSREREAALKLQDKPLRW